MIYLGQIRETPMIRVLSLAIAALLSLSSLAYAQGCDDGPPPPPQGDTPST